MNAKQFRSRLRMTPDRTTCKSIHLSLVKIPKGCFTMGSTPEELEGLRATAKAEKQRFADKGMANVPWIDFWLKYLNNEGPHHQVTFADCFWMSAREITVGQWEQFIRATGCLTEVERFEETKVKSFGLDLITGWVEPKPYYTWRFWLREDKNHPSNFKQTDEHPVVCVSWNDAMKFCAWLTEVEGKKFRLPTEAEWEYACRAGSRTRYANGDEVESLRKIANVADRSLPEKWIMTDPGTGAKFGAPPYAQEWRDGNPFTATVGSFAPNAWGLYDMHGNVGEWCLDWYDGGYKNRLAGAQSLVDPVFDPVEPPDVDFREVQPASTPEPLRVVRGGVWLDPAFGLRCADRETHRRHPVHSAADIGFRVVCSETLPNNVAKDGTAGGEAVACAPEASKETASSTSRLGRKNNKTDAALAADYLHERVFQTFRSILGSSLRIADAVSASMARELIQLEGFAPVFFKLGDGAAAGVGSLLAPLFGEACAEETRAKLRAFACYRDPDTSSAGPIPVESAWSTCVELSLLRDSFSSVWLFEGWAAALGRTAYEQAHIRAMQSSNSLPPPRGGLHFRCLRFTPVSA